MANMFDNTGKFSTIFTLDLGSKFNTSKVTNMSNMFIMAGYSNTSFTLNLGSLFDTSRVTNMDQMFKYTGFANSNFTLDLSTFSFNNVTDYVEFLYGFNLSGTIYVKNSSDRSWVITNGGSPNLSTSNVLIKT